MEMKKTLIVASVLMAGPVALALQAQEPPTTPAQAKEKAAAIEFAGNKTVKGFPFSAVEVTTMLQTLADGNHILRMTRRKVYRDSQGRERAEPDPPTMSVLGEQVGVAMVTIADPVAGVTYNLDPSKSVARRIPRVNFSLANMALVPKLVGGTRVLEQLPPDTPEGVYATGTRATTTIPAGQVGNEKDLNIVDEAWYSPDLQMNVMTMHDDPRSGKTLYRLTNIVREEPEASLFQVPPGYTVQDPPKTSTLFVMSPDGKTTTGPITIPLPQ
jgi:hypothetical protein